LILELSVKYLVLLCLAATCLFASSAVADEIVPADPPLRYWKGNIHTHTLWSDGNDFPEMVAEWYRTHGYNFLSLSDHNILSEGEKYRSYDYIKRRGGEIILSRYEKRFGGGWIETRGVKGQSNYEIRLKPLNEFRALVEERGKFIMVQGEEISDRSQGKPIHMNATNIKQLVLPLGGATPRQAIENNLRSVEEQAKREHREILVHVNHPNFGYALTAEDLASVIRERFFEVFNGHPGVNHHGDHMHPGVEQLWDIANTIRLDRLNAAPLYGVGTDDSHVYDGRPGAKPGRGWVQVRSRYLTPSHLVKAMKAGDFYASSGVELKRIEVTEENELQIDIDAKPGVLYTTQFIGTPRNYDRTVKPRMSKDGKPLATTYQYSEEVGKVFATVTGEQPRYKITGQELYVRAVITSSDHHPNTSFDHQHEQAWTQPVGWSLEVDAPPEPE